MLAQLRVAKLDVVDLADTRLQDPAQERLELGQVMQNSRDSPCDEVLRSKPLLQVEKLLKKGCKFTIQLHL